MPQKFQLSELDRHTREYLLEVRDNQGKKMPGLFAEVANPLPTIGCICGPLVVVFTLIFTLTDAINVIYDDPNRVAFLQTAGILIGGWMFVAAFRVWFGKKSPSSLGHWVYVDALHLYQAQGSEVVAWPVPEMKRASFTHGYNTDTYQRTDVEVRFPKKEVCKFTIKGEEKAERFVAFINYLAFVYGPDGGKREELPPDRLGMLARHVAKNDDEPLDENGEPDMSRVSGSYDGEVPEEPERARRAPPHILPYIFLLVAAVLCYVVMRSIDIPIRDNAMYEAVSRPPVEPRYIRAYLIDPRNSINRDAAAKQLATFYDPVEARLRGMAPKNDLRDGFADLIHSVRTADQAVVSIRVAESKSPPGNTGGDDRAKRLREELPKRIATALTPMSRSTTPPPGTVVTPPPPPVGEQLFAFVEAPSDAPGAHFDINYWFEPKDKGKFELQCRVEIRTKIDDKPVASSTFALAGSYAADQADTAVNALLSQIVTDMTGPQPGNPLPMPGMPGMPIPNF